MTIAGSDSSGGAGIQADLRTFQCLGVHGTSVVTCVTAQNPYRILRIGQVAPRLVRLQILAVSESFSIAAAKTGMLYSAPIIRAVATTLKRCCPPQLVVDPIMISSSGTRLLRSNALTPLYEELFPLATVLTPNVPEAEAILGIKINGRRAAEEAARRIAEEFKCACIVKGGHLPRQGDESIDLLWTEGRLHVLSGPRVCGVSPRGTGCTFSAALAAFLAKGFPLVKAAARAKRFVFESLFQPAATRHPPR